MQNKLKRRLDRIRSRSPTHPRSPDPGPRELEPPFGLSLGSGAILRRGLLTISDLLAGLAEEGDVYGFADSAPIDVFEMLRTSQYADTICRGVCTFRHLERIQNPLPKRCTGNNNSTYPDVEADSRLAISRYPVFNWVTDKGLLSDVSAKGSSSSIKLLLTV